MRYSIEVKTRCSEEQHYLSKGPKGFALIVKERNAEDYPTLEAATKDISELITWTPKAIRKLLGKESTFVTPVTFTVVSWKNSDTAPFRVRQKFYSFTETE